MTFPDPDKIRSALCTQAPTPALAGRVGCAHWQGVVTVYTETDETFLVTGYDSREARLSLCEKVQPVQIETIYHVFDRDHPAIVALGVKNAPHCHYTGP